MPQEIMHLTVLTIRFWIMFTVRTEQKHRTLFILWVIMNFTVATRNTIFTSQPVFLSTQERLLTAIALSPFLIQNLKKEMKSLPKATIHLQMEHIMRKE